MSEARWQSEAAKWGYRAAILGVVTALVTALSPLVELVPDWLGPKPADPVVADAGGETPPVTADVTAAGPSQAPSEPRVRTAGLGGASPSASPVTAGETVAAEPAAETEAAPEEVAALPSEPTPTLPTAATTDPLRAGDEVAACGTIGARLVMQPPSRVVLQRLDGGGEVELNLGRDPVAIFDTCSAALISMETPLHRNAPVAVISFSPLEDT